MTQSVSAVSDAWLYTFIIQPHLEAIARLNLVWARQDFSSFVPRDLSIEDRLIYLISGLALMIPLVATIVWICMETFGHPDHLSDSYQVAIERGPNPLF